MRYIYYIVTILIMFSIFAVYQLLDTKVEISEPAIVINDRIITQKEYNKLMATMTSDIDKESYIDAVVLKELLIQEAIKQKINNEESFRQSVQNFYEQSLVKILLDRKMNSLEVKVSEEEISKYREMVSTKVLLTKIIYKNLSDAEKNIINSVKQIEAEFLGLSDSLQYIVLNLDNGQTSKPSESEMGIVVYKLEKTQKVKELSSLQNIDIQKVIAFFSENKKEELLDSWMDDLKKNAEIWRKK